MKIRFSSPEEAERVKAKALLLAYQASIPMGMGFLHYKENAEKDAEMLAEYITPGEDLYADYVVGRMVKLTIRQPEPDMLDIRDAPPHPEYQSWVVKYPTYEALIEAARQ